MTTPLLALPAGSTDTFHSGLVVPQRIAAGSPTPRVFIEAGPGSGKTTVAAERFGVLRFAPGTRSGDRGVVAVSFARSAVSNLRSRIARRWGPEALAAPNHVTTVDTVIRQLLRELLICGLVQWPGGHTELTVHDSWRSLGLNYRSYGGPDLLSCIDGVITESPAAPNAVVQHIRDGVCTHEDVRSVLAQALKDEWCRLQAVVWFQQRVRALMVDEAFDANDLDIEIVRLAVDGGVSVTLVGDPWQTLYEFRGARPEKVNALLLEKDIPTLRLLQSFRWRTEAQRELADLLRAGQPVALPSRGQADLDVVIGTQWQSLWNAGTDVLPIAFHGFRGEVAEAAETLLLSHVTRQMFGYDGVYLRDALSTLKVLDQKPLTQIQPELQQAAESLKESDTFALQRASAQLVVAVNKVSTRVLDPRHWDVERLGRLARRLRFSGRLVPGLTAHQAKGQEWDSVGVCLNGGERTALARGLSVWSEPHRKVYVACTRARRSTFLID